MIPAYASDIIQKWQFNSYIKADNIRIKKVTENNRTGLEI